MEQINKWLHPLGVYNPLPATQAWFPNYVSFDYLTNLFVIRQDVVNHHGQTYLAVFFSSIFIPDEDLLVAIW